MKKYIKVNISINATMKKFLAIVSILLVLGALTDASAAVISNFQQWAGSLVSVIGQFKRFFQIALGLVGFFSLGHGLLHLKKSSTPMGQQQNSLPQGIGSIVLGVALLSCVPLIQTLQSSFMNKTGDGSTNQLSTFTVMQHGIGSANNDDGSDIQ